MRPTSRLFRPRPLAIAVAILLCVVHLPAIPPALIRGPYEQLVTTHSAILRWRTSIACDSRVEFGLTTATMTQSVQNAADLTEHSIQLDGLAPDQTYFYSVGLTTFRLAGGDAGHVIHTAPAAPTGHALRVWILGDPGANTPEARAVRDGFTLFSGGALPNFWMILGDNAYETGSDSDYQNGFFSWLGAMLAARPVMPAFGNHDAISANSSTQTGPYFDIFDLPKNAEAGGVASHTEAYYSFDYDNLHVICLNAMGADLTASGPMLTWLRADLAAVADPHRWIVAFWHHPPYTDGTHLSDNPADSEGRMTAMRQNALPILEAGGVDLVLCGHSHVYERSFLMDGDYTTAAQFDPATILDAGPGPYVKRLAAGKAHRGAIYVVCGDSARTEPLLGHLAYPTMRFSSQLQGSLVLDVAGDRLDCKFIDGSAQTLDQFTILKDFTKSAAGGDWMIYR